MDGARIGKSPSKSRSEENMVTWGFFGGWDGIISGRRDQMFDSCRGLVWSSSIPGTTEPGFSCPVTASFTTSILQEKCSGTLPRTRDIKRYLPASLGKGPWEEAAPPRTRNPLAAHLGKYRNLGKIPTEKILQFQFFDNRVHPNPPINHLHFLQ